MLKQILIFLLGELGQLLISIVFSVVSWFLMPIFVDILRATHPLSSILGWLFVCPFAIAFFITAVYSAIALVTKGAKSKKWHWVVLGSLVLVFDVVILVQSII